MRRCGDLRTAALGAAAGFLCLGLYAANAPGAPGAERQPSSPPAAESPRAPTGSLDLASYADHPEVRSELRYFQSRGRSSMQRWLERSGTYLPMIRTRLAEAELPEELCWLPMIESGFSNTAISRKGAVGLWQFMPETARRYGLRVDRFVDERRNPLKATSAAVRHLSDLMTRFGSPFLAAAAYNSGAGRVLRGLERLDGRAGARARPSIPGEQGKTDPDPASPVPGAGNLEPSFTDADFFRLSDASLLALETRQYVPRLIAASLIAREPDRFGFRPHGAKGLDVDSVVVDKATRLDQIARATGVSERLLRDLNPEYVRGVTPPRTRSIVLLPPGAPGDAARRIAALPVARATWPNPAEAGLGSRAARRPGTSPAPGTTGRRYVRVRRGESLADVARRIEVSSTELARVNLIPRGYRLHPSQILRVP